MAVEGGAKMRAQWVAAAMREEKERLERRQKLMGELYDEVGRYMAAIMSARKILSALTTEHDVSKSQIKSLFGLTDREVAVLYGGRSVSAVQHETDSPVPDQQTECGDCVQETGMPTMSMGGMHISQ